MSVRINMDAVRAKLRERERRDAQRAAMDAALGAVADVQRAALNPPGGWWRTSKRRSTAPDRTLRRSCVIEAMSVGCSAGQIASAAGTSIWRVHSAAGAAKRCETVPEDRPLATPIYKPSRSKARNA